MAEISNFIADLQLARHALKDREAQEAILERLYPRIARIVVLVVGNHNHADDIVQLAALEVVKSLKWYKGLGSLESWASRIAYRTTVRILKRHREKQQFHLPLHELDMAGGDSPEVSVSRKRLFEVLVDKMSVIPEKRRVPFLLHTINGYTVREVAEMIEVSPNTVKDRLKTAVREFRTLLYEHPTLLKAMLEERL